MYALWLVAQSLGAPKDLDYLTQLVLLWGSYLLKGCQTNSSIGIPKLCPMFVCGYLNLSEAAAR